MNMSCVHSILCGDYQVSTNIVCSGGVQLIAVCKMSVIQCWPLVSHGLTIM